MEGRLIEVVLRVRDLARSVAFYRDVLGVPVGPGDDAETPHFEAFWGEWEPGRADMLMLLMYSASGEDDLTRTEIGFNVGDLGSVHRAVEGAGYDVVSAPTQKPWGLQATYRDPDGNRVSVAQAPAKDGHAT